MTKLRELTPPSHSCSLEGTVRDKPLIIRRNRFRLTFREGLLLKILGLVHHRVNFLSHPIIDGLLHIYIKCIEVEIRIRSEQKRLNVFDHLIKSVLLNFAELVQGQKHVDTVILEFIFHPPN